MGRSLAGNSFSDRILESALEGAGGKFA